MINDGRQEQKERARLSAKILLAFGLISLGVTLVVGFISSHLGAAVIAGLLTGLGLVGAYALLAQLFGWQKLRWDDVTALWYMLP